MSLYILVILIPLRNTSEFSYFFNTKKRDRKIYAQYLLVFFEIIKQHLKYMVGDILQDKGYGACKCGLLYRENVNGRAKSDRNINGENVLV